MRRLLIAGGTLLAVLLPLTADAGPDVGKGDPTPQPPNCRHTLIAPCPPPICRQFGVPCSSKPAPPFRDTVTPRWVRR